MILAVFGKKVFEIKPGKILTFDGMQYGTSLETEKQDAAGQKPSTYIKGPGLDTLSITTQAKLQLGVDPITEMAEWRAVMQAKKPQYLVIGGRPFGQNQWLLVDVQMSDTTLDGGARITECTLSLKFDEWVRPGKAPATSGSSAKGIKKNSGAATSVIMSEAEKESLKDGGW